LRVVILAGGMGTRLGDETSVRPKPMVEIGGKPILWHIMQRYAAYGHNEFILCTGYRSEMIEDYVENVPWKTIVVNAGTDALTGDRLKSIRPLIHSTFMMTYGDGVADIPIDELVDFHTSHYREATVTAVHPPARFGVMHLDGTAVISFKEKPQSDAGWVNGGFFVLEPHVLDTIPDNTMFEHACLEDLAARDQLRAYCHEGYWQPMDTMRDKRTLEEMYEGGAPWIVSMDQES
jgi:glucose-1-phosphate cytidylyltransferase